MLNRRQRLGKLPDLSGLYQGHPWAPPCPRLAKIVMLRGREPRQLPCQRAFPSVGSRYPKLPGRVTWREKKPARDRLGWGGERAGDPGREGCFGEREVLGGLAGEERLVEV